MDNTRIVIITGLSGSGKSTAIRALEDSGFFCIDNLPMVLLPKLLDLKSQFTTEALKLALVMDLREKDFFDTYPEVFKELQAGGYRFEIIFLEATDESLVQRYSQTRRQHPFKQPGPLAESIRQERERLAGLRRMADRVLDTTHLTIHELREIMIQHVAALPIRERLRIEVMSFGYKYGLPHEADLVMDVRFLPNPHFVTHLKPKDGRDPEVASYVMGREFAEPFLRKFSDLLLTLIPLYRQEGKSYLTVAVGCTGGRHRSVAVVEALAQFLDRNEIKVFVRHRDIGKE